MASSGPGPSGKAKKRAASDHDPTISPPPLKRKVPSAISKSAVANFFTPVSQKPKDRTTWSERSPHDDVPATLLVAKHVPESADAVPGPKRRKIAAFDLDSTLIVPASGKKHASDANDWKWWDTCVPSRLRQLYEEGYLVVVLSNQAGLTLHPDPKSKPPKSLKDRVSSFRQKCSAVLAQLDIPLTLYAATGKDIYRKPRHGMWEEMRQDYDLAESDIELQSSIFVGDAGGRAAYVRAGSAVAKDFSCSDRNLAHNIGIKYQTPEEFFLDEKPRDFARDFDPQDFPFTRDGVESATHFEASEKREIVLFCGPPGAGKSTFYWSRLKPLGYERVNQDTLKTKDKCFKAAADLLKAGDSVAIDNTNPDPDTRAQWIELAKKNKVSIRCIWFKTPPLVCEHNDAVRSMNKKMNPESRQILPKLAFNSFASRFKEPKIEEGFGEVIPVEFRFRGSEDDYELWAKYWI